jgi:hypothetical protein
MISALIMAIASSNHLMKSDSISPHSKTKLQEMRTEWQTLLKQALEADKAAR